MDNNFEASSYSDVGEMLGGAINREAEGGITEFMTAFESLPHCTDSEGVQKHSELVLQGFYTHPAMAESIMKSTLTGYLYRHGSESIHLALSSRWVRLVLNPIFIAPHKNPLGLSIDVTFNMEQTDQEDATEEAVKLVSNLVKKRNLQAVILQIVVNNNAVRFNKGGK